jgi:hypothetical protein
MHDGAEHPALPCVALRRHKSCRFLCRWDAALRSHRLAGLALLLMLPAHVAAQEAITNANLNTAVTAWMNNPSTAETTYGPIADWNTAAVTSFASLLYPAGTARPTFNGDISKWNTASVSNMFQACALLPSRATGVLFAAVVPAASGPRRRCGNGPPRMRASPGAGVGVSRGADVGQVWLNCERVLCTTSINATWWRVATRLCDEAPLNASFDISAMFVAAAWHGSAGALGFVHCAVDGVGSARRRFTRRRRSTRTSAAGTPRVFRTCTRHAPSCRRA